MVTSSFPTPLAKLFTDFVPPAFFDKTAQLVLAKIQIRHPKLFKNLSELPAARILLEPTDIRFRFLLEVGQNPVAFSRVDDDCQAEAKVSGPLQALVDMLEGRVDGDTLFFARDIRITGDTAVIVALRNTLDREEINLLDEILSLCGPFAQPARQALGLAGHLLQRIRDRVGRAHDNLHEKQGEAAS